MKHSGIPKRGDLVVFGVNFVSLALKHEQENMFDFIKTYHLNERSGDMIGKVHLTNKNLIIR